MCTTHDGRTLIVATHAHIHNLMLIMNETELDQCHNIDSAHGRVSNNDVRFNDASMGDFGGACLECTAHGG